MIKKISILIGIILACIFLYKITYKAELRKIKRELNSIEGVEVLNIWGHDDIALEEISARLHVKGKGTIVLGSLSKDVFNYPKHVYVDEINGKTFQGFSCYYSLGLGRSIDIGTESYLASEINLVIYSPIDIIRNFDLIDSIIDSLPRFPKVKYFSNDESEYYVGVLERKSEDVDPLYNLMGLESMASYGRKLKWRNKKCNR